MNDLRAAKLIASAILMAAGALCMALSDQRGGVAFFLGLILVIVGAPVMAIQWRIRKGGESVEPGGLSERSIETEIKETKDF